MKPLNLYIHIPYCKYRCRYCNFYVVAGRTPQLPLYFKALKKELNSYTRFVGLNPNSTKFLTHDMLKNASENYEIKTIYFGGGTPSLVYASSISDFIEFVKTNFKVSKNLDISIEVNPENITKEKLEEYYKCGIRRLSIGLQAW